MKRTRRTPAVTSLPQSPQDESTHRVRRYALTMGIRIVCFGLMALVQPYGWYTWIFGAAAAFLPYIAVVFANAGSDSTSSSIESPARELPAPRPAAPEVEGDPTVITIREKREDSEQ